MKTEIGTDVLAEHGRFVRQLAQALVREPHLADDVAQETWLRWFTRPPRDASRPRAWLARVTQGVALNLRRSEGRRADIERGAVPSESGGASPDASMRQAELIERVAAAVRALEAPHREVILARFFRGLSVRELAHESGVSEEALRSRERRALEQLREKLDRDFGARSAWALALARFAEGPTPLLPPHGASSASSPVWLAAGLCGLAGALGFVAWRTLGATPTMQVGTSQAALGSVTGSPESSVPRTPALAQREPAVTTSASDTNVRGARDDGREDSTSALTSLPLSELRARFLLENGSPAAGASWSLDGELANDELAELYDLPEDWSDPAGVLEADGSLLLQFEAPRAYQFYLHVKAPGHTLASFWFVPAPEELLDFGTVSLERGATIQGRLLDASGAPIVGERWHVRADALEALADEQREVLPTFADVDEATGAFLLEDVPPGRVTLEASP